MDSLANSKNDKPTGGFSSESHKPGIRICRTKGRLSEQDLEKWREELEAFVKDNASRGACGMLIDISEAEALNVDALDVLLELLADPEEVIRETTRMRFALIGVKPFAQRFLREVMPLEPVKHIRARFFHEVAEKEALAWLSAMVESADDLPDPADSSKETPEAKTEKKKEPVKEKEAKKPSPTPTASAKPEPGKKTPEPSLRDRILGRKKPDQDTAA
jgi:hypothetical protein